MDDVLGINWVDYFHRLSDDELRKLAAWLAAELLQVSEFTDILDRVYTHTADEWHGRSLAFVATCGRPVVEGYADRKRRFAELMAAFDDAQMSGAFSGDVAPEELRPLRRPQITSRTADDLLSVLVRVRSGPS